MSTKTLRKRIALVAVSAMGFGLLSAAPSSAAVLAGTSSVGPVRVSMTGASQDTVLGAAVTLTGNAGFTDADVPAGAGTLTVALTTAPSAAAQITIASTLFEATTDTSVTLADDGVLTDTNADVDTSAEALANGLTFNANVSGTYVGTIVIADAGGADSLSVPFTFTTTGAPTTLEVSASATSVNPLGTSTITATLKDAAGLTTQGSTVDSIGFTATIGSMGTASLDAAALSDGTGTSLLTTTSATATANVVTITPQGTLGGLGVKTLTVTTDATTIFATNDANIAFTVTAPADAAAVAGTVDAGDRAQSVRTGSSAITVSVTNAAVSSNLRFKVTASAGTVDGVAFGTPQYKVVATSSTGAGSLSFTLGGGALLTNATVTVEQVSVVNASIATVAASATTDIVITQAASAVAAGTVSASIAGSVVRAIGTVTSVDLTVKDQYAGALGAGWTIRAYRGSKSAANLLSTATTNASGVATVSVNGVSTITTGTAETYVYSADYPGVTQIDVTSTLTVTYTTTGEITSLSTAITGTTGASTPVTDTTLASAVTIYPAIVVPSDGSASDASGDQVYTVSTGAVTGTGGATAEVITLASNATADNTATYTADAGSYVSTTATTAWNAGASSVTVAEGVSVYVFATTVGLHTITVTSGGKTVLIKFWAYNLATDYYTISAVADNATPKTGANTIVTVTVKDVFGNVVDAADGLLTATAAASVRLAGQALTQALNTTAAGTSSFTIIADATAGTGTITIAPTATGAAAWASGYTVPTGAGAVVKSATVTITVEGAPAKSPELLAIEAIQATVAADKIATDLKIALLQAALDAAKADAAAAAAKAVTDAEALATKAAADKAALEAAIAAAATKAAADTAAAQAAAVAASEAAADAAAEAIDAGNNAYDSANAATDAADAATAAAQQAGEDAVAAAEAAGAAAVEAAQSAQDAAAEATDAATAATDAANAAAEAADAATAAAQDAADAVAALSVQVTEMVASLKKQITALTNLVIRIQKKVKA